MKLALSLALGLVALFVVFLGCGYGAYDSPGYAGDFVPGPAPVPFVVHFHGAPVRRPAPVVVNRITNVAVNVPRPRLAYPRYSAPRSPYRSNFGTYSRRSRR